MPGFVLLDVAMVLMVCPVTNPPAIHSKATPFLAPTIIHREL
jgi:hypothetical protein